jgi:hypothetical protein
MRYLILIASLALAGAAFADDKSTSTTRELDKSSPRLMTSGDSSGTTDSSATGRHDAASGKPTGRRQHGVVSPQDAASGMASGKRQHGSAPADAGSSSGASGSTRAQDYNSSRSNTTSLREDKAGDLDRDGRVDVVTCGNGKDNDCDDTGRPATPGDYNGTRSNRSGATGTRSHNASRSNRSSGTRAQDYNSSRSNNSSARLDPDSDGDSLDEVRCSMASDDCVTRSDGEDLTLRKRPGR